jgi:epoxyqueuosine reductase
MKTRREFLKTGTGMFFGIGSFLTLARSFPGNPEQDAAPKLKYASMPVSWLKRLQSDSEQIVNSGLISNQKTFRSYLEGRTFSPPEELPNARSVLVAAIPQKPVQIHFRWHGKRHAVLVPTGYTRGWFPMEKLKSFIKQRIVKNPSTKLIPARLPLKLLAARTGLGRYGRNNICFVEGYGSFHSLIAFFSDHEFSQSRWLKPIRPPRLCKGCTICIKQCPTGAISDHQFPINAGRCITLYNELPDPIPAWINPGFHNSLVGCLRCQFPCPLNAKIVNDRLELADLSEAETVALLENNPGPELEKSIRQKLNRLGLISDLSHLSRNLNLLLKRPSIEN